MGPMILPGAGCCGQERHRALPLHHHGQAACFFGSLKRPRCQDCMQAAQLKEQDAGRLVLPFQMS